MKRKKKNNNDDSSNGSDDKNKKPKEFSSVNIKQWKKFSDRNKKNRDFWNLFFPNSFYVYTFKTHSMRILFDLKINSPTTEKQLTKYFNYSKSNHEIRDYTRNWWVVILNIRAIPEYGRCKTVADIKSLTSIIRGQIVLFLYKVFN